MKRVATIILNRNLPEVADKLHDHLINYDNESTDIFVLEAGSDKDKLSKHTTWHANSKDEMKKGLRYPRGMNYALSSLWKEGVFDNYDAFFLLTNDTELEKKSSLSSLLHIMDKNPTIGILSPCGKSWGERLLLEKNSLKFFWYIHNSAYFLRREFIESVFNVKKPFTLNFLFDGNNFRGYQTESELVAKAYINDWSAAITSEVLVSENESYLLDKSDLIKTETYDENLKLYVEEGKTWMREKYGFNSRWTFQQYTKFFYDQFFELHPELIDFKI